jgi:hypothetical protein
MTDQEDFEPKAPYLEELDSESHVRAWAAKYDGYSKTGGKQRPHDCVSEIVLLALVTCGIDTKRHGQSKEEKGLNNKAFIDAILSLHTADNLEVAKDAGCAAIDALEMDGEFGVGSSRYLMDFGKATKAHVKGLTEVEPAYILNSFVKGIRPKAVCDAVKRGVVGPDKEWSDAGRLLVARARDIEAKRAELERLNGTIETLETERAAPTKKLVRLKPAAGLSVSPVSASEPKTPETTEPSQDRSNRVRPCWRCGSCDHLQRDCPEPEDAGRAHDCSEKGGLQLRVQCDQYKEWGHLSRDCPASAGSLVPKSTHPVPTRRVYKLMKAHSEREVPRMEIPVMCYTSEHGDSTWCRDAHGDIWWRDC